MNELLLSIVIPAYNEEMNIPGTVEELQKTLRAESIPYELVIVNDNSKDSTPDVVRKLMETDSGIRLVNRTPPGGFGRAIRSGLDAVKGDVVVIYMADCSDDPKNVIQYYRLIEDGNDCVFGSRFISGSKVEHYPKVKLVVNRIVNKCIQMMFRCKFNDLTNAFKAYRTEVIRECGPFQSSHFNITLELSLSALIRRYKIVQIPINWYGRTWGVSNLKMREMGRRYLAILLKIFCERIFIVDDLIAEKEAHQRFRDEKQIEQTTEKDAG